MARFTNYPKGSDLLFHIACPDCDTLEKQIVEQFKNKYIQITDYGIEYFQGNPDEMINIIFNLVKTYANHNQKNPNNKYQLYKHQLLYNQKMIQPITLSLNTTQMKKLKNIIVLGVQKILLPQMVCGNIIINIIMLN